MNVDNANDLVPFVDKALLDKVTCVVKSHHPKQSPLSSFDDPKVKFYYVHFTIQLG